MNNFLEARRFFTSKVKFYQDEVVQIYGYIKVVDKLVKYVYENEPDCASRKAKIDYFRRLRHKRELMGLTSMQYIIEYQSLLLDLYESTFVLGRRFFFF